jgi:hypothetical protein
LLPEFYKDLHQTCRVMLKQWSKPILIKWIDVFCGLIPLLLKEPESNKEKLIAECVDACL